nr:reverse transcriptase domain-containing protein [Tanacetum cinerariifolium]
MTHVVIRKLVADSVATALEAQVAMMASTNNLNRNLGQEKLMNCAKKNKVKFAINTLTEEALFWWNSFAQPIGVKEAYKITWNTTNGNNNNYRNNNLSNDHHHQQNRKQETFRTHTATNGYTRNRPLCER